MQLHRARNGIHRICEVEEEGRRGTRARRRERERKRERGSGQHKRTSINDPKQPGKGGENATVLTGAVRGHVRLGYI